MRKTIITLLVITASFLSLYSCKSKEDKSNQEKTNSIVINGRIVNTEGKKVLLTRSGFKKEAELDEKGNFMIVLSTQEFQRYIFNQGNEYAILFLEPGDSINIVFDVTKFHDTYEVSGKGFEESLYLFKKQAILDEFTIVSENSARLKQEEFISQLSNYQTKFLENLALFNEKYKINSDFFSSEKTNIQFQIVSAKMEYAEVNNIESKDFFLFLNELDLNDNSFLRSSEFINFLDLYVNHKTRENISKADVISSILRKFQLIPSLFSNSEIIDFALYQAMNDYVYDYKSNTEKEIRDVFFEVCKNEKYHDRIQNELNEKAIVGNGSIAPLFELPNRQEEKIGLKDFHGKYVFIDFWATWCSPCLKEIPVIEEWKKKSEDYSDKVVFLSISLDINKEKWENMVDKKEMEGYQLIAEKGLVAKISKEYNITSLPRFILIDPEGQLMDVNYPKPSSKEGEYLFNKLLANL